MKTQILRGLVTVCVSISIAAGLNGCGSEKEKTDQPQMSGTMETPEANSLEESGRKPGGKRRGIRKRFKRSRRACL